LAISNILSRDLGHEFTRRAGRSRAARRQISSGTLIRCWNAIAYDCHTDEDAKGGVDFGAFDPNQDYAASRDLWWRVLKNVRANLMPPSGKSQPTAEDRALLERWIKLEVFASNPAQPDPGRVTLRRLNRVEYRNTVRDLVGIDFDTTGEFPPDDTGHGFDNIGDVLTLSPLLLEKYLEAAQIIVAQLIPEGGGGEEAARSRSRRNAVKMFTKPIPLESSAQRSYAEELLRDFATRAFRRPVDEASLARLVDLAEQNYRQPGQSFQSGVASALVAVLASPRFLFREEMALASGAGEKSGATFPLVDEYSLAARLSYFLWASMPDAELFRLAGPEHCGNNSPNNCSACGRIPRAALSSAILSGNGCTRGTSNRFRLMRGR
jgi:hypothetical protein